MRMSDLVGSMDMALFPIIGLVIFLGLFGVLIVRALMSDPGEGRRAAGIPLDDGEAGAGSVDRGVNGQERA